MKLCLHVSCAVGALPNTSPCQFVRKICCFSRFAITRIKVSVSASLRSNHIYDNYSASCDFCDQFDEYFCFLCGKNRRSSLYGGSTAIFSISFPFLIHHSDSYFEHLRAFNCHQPWDLDESTVTWTFKVANHDFHLIVVQFNFSI